MHCYMLPRHWKRVHAAVRTATDSGSTAADSCSSHSRASDAGPAHAGADPGRHALVLQSADRCCRHPVQLPRGVRCQLLCGVHTVHWQVERHFLLLGHAATDSLTADARATDVCAAGTRTDSGSADASSRPEAEADANHSRANHYQFPIINAGT